VELATVGAGSFRRTARRYSLCGDDADDAYQRSLEILLTKAPTASRAELRPWLHTVIKHEALALRRQRERVGVADEAAAGECAASERNPEEAAASHERVRQTAEALGVLKPNELQCLVLKALGYSYEEISARTGFSWTKVNRSLTQGRRRFFECFGEIASGDRCERFQPLLSAICDGHAVTDEGSVRAHLEACPSCRAALRAYRSAPARLAELLPPSIVLPLLDRGGLWSRLGEWLPFGAAERASAVAAKLHQTAEVASAQKAAAVVASTAAIAGGGAAVHHDALPDPGRDRPARAEPAAPHAEREPGAPPVQPGPALAEAPDTPADEASGPDTAPASSQTPAEFGFESAAAPAEPAHDAPSAEAAAASERESFGPGGGAAPAGGGGEFGP
jgi:RNA polymerase sigma factor (sigma-70 family)